MTVIIAIIVAIILITTNEKKHDNNDDEDEDKYNNHNMCERDWHHEDRLCISARRAAFGHAMIMIMITINNVMAFPIECS